MPCKICGQNLTRRFPITHLLLSEDGTKILGKVLEILCWGCVYWTQTGTLMPERRV